MRRKLERENAWAGETIYGIGRTSVLARQYERRNSRMEIRVRRLMRWVLVFTQDIHNQRRLVEHEITICCNLQELKNRRSKAPQFRR